MAQNKYVNKKKVINRFILGMSIWMATILIITFVQSSHTRGLFFLVAIGVSFVYLAIAHVFQPRIDDKTGWYGQPVDDPFARKAVSNTYSVLAFIQVLFWPGRILGSWIFGIISLRQRSD